MSEPRKPLVSVIIVVYNAGRILENAIKSVLSQRYPNKELLIIDGKSSGETLDVIRQYQAKIDHFVSEKDSGIYDAMNKGILAAKGEWLIFLGADDVFYDEDVLSQVFDDPANQAFDFIYGNVQLKHRQSSMGEPKTWMSLIERNICHQGIFYRNFVFETVGPYNIRYKILADYDMNLRVFEKESLRKKYLPFNIAIFNEKGGASHSTIDQPFFRDRLAYFCSERNFKPNNPLLQQYHFYTGICLFFQQSPVQGLRSCVRAFLRGERKLFFFLLLLKLTIENYLLRKKVKIV